MVKIRDISQTTPVQTFIATVEQVSVWRLGPDLITPQDMITKMCNSPSPPPSKPTGGCWGGGGAEATGSNTDTAAGQAKGAMVNFLCLNSTPNKVGGYYRWLRRVRYVTWCTELELAASTSRRGSICANLWVCVVQVLAMLCRPKSIYTVGGLRKFVLTHLTTCFSFQSSFGHTKSFQYTAVSGCLITLLLSIISLIIESAFWRDLSWILCVIVFVWKCSRLLSQCFLFLYVHRMVNPVAAESLCVCAPIGVPVCGQWAALCVYM